MFPERETLIKYLSDRAIGPDVVIPLFSENGHSKEIHDALSECHGHWVISRDLGEFIVNLIDYFDVTRVIEFGAGVSSIVIASALSRRPNGLLHSVEQHPEWCSRYWSRVGKFDNLSTKIFPADLSIKVGWLGCYYQYNVDLQGRDDQEGYQLVLIDGPQHYFGRDGVLPLISNMLSPGALIVLDDAGRYGEQLAMWSWLESYERLKLVFFDPEWGKKGLAVFQTEGGIRPSFSLRIFLLGMYRGLKRIKNNIRSGRSG